MKRATPHITAASVIGSGVSLLSAAVVLIVMAVASTVLAGCGSSSAVAAGILELGPSDNGKTYTVRVGDTIQVSVPGNPTTGYGWAVSAPEGGETLLVQQEEPLYVPDKTDEQVVGSGGVYIFTFKAGGIGQETLSLVYSRPWEGGQPAETYAVTVNIE